MTVIAQIEECKRPKFEVRYGPTLVQHRQKFSEDRLPHRKNFFSESQLSPIVKSNLVEITRIPVYENHVHRVKQANINLVTEK